MGILIDTLKIARETVSTHESAVRSIRAQIETTEKALAKAMRNQNFKRTTQLQSDLENHRAVLTSVEYALADAQARVTEAEKALYEARKARYEERTQAAKEQIGAGESMQADLTLKRDSYGTRDAFISTRWEVSLVELDANGEPVTKTYERSGETFSYVERRFGFEATVYGPEQDWRGTWRGAQINWGTLGAQSVADARDMMRVHSAAITLAAWLEEKRDAWVAEDMAD